ncbi:DUF6904 family protein [Gillisia sp. Hel_I_29]|uniref:DUF6904 family protein n=1 Tax=Gillisia sp. Hel_I_29 TaxID=1249975 RepID=UPI0005557B77|nr:hypothetical protein [Gillisia sp. Hel_I_29]
MFYIIPTKNGLGVEFWGTPDDLRNIYSVIGNLWNKDDYLYKQGFESRDKVISGFSYELRKAFEKNRLKREYSHFSLEPIEYMGFKIYWVHALFTFSALRYNMKYFETNKFDLSIFLQIEFWLEKAMNQFDSKGAANLKPYISDSIYSANEYIYLFMRRINIEYLQMGGGKKAFRELPVLMKKAVFYNREYDEYSKQLKEDADLLGCKISELEINDEHMDYENLKW